MRMTVIGTGYLGAVHAACMADIGHEVLGVDSDPRKVELLRQGRPPFYEPGLDELLKDAVRGGRLSFATSLAEAARFADVHFICVGTPQRQDSHHADLGVLHAVVDELAPQLTRDSLIVGKSTVPVGTAAAISERIAGLAPPGIRVEVAWNPEFLREGRALHDSFHPSRIVWGARSERGKQNHAGEG